MNENGDKCYLILKNSATYSYQIWEMNLVSSISLSWTNILSDIQSGFEFIYAGSSLVYISGMNSTYAKLYFSLYNFNTLTIEWSKSFSWSWSSSSTKSVFSSDTSIIYSMIYYYPNFIFISQNIVDGTIINEFTQTWYYAELINIIDVLGKIYFSYKSTTHYIAIFDPSSKSFKYYSISNTLITLYYAAYNFCSLILFLSL